MSEEEISLLYNSIKDVLNLSRVSREKGTFAYESDFFGLKGNFTTDDFLVGYEMKQAQYGLEPSILCLFFCALATVTESLAFCVLLILPAGVKR